MIFRDYQEYAIESIFRYFMDGGTGNPIVAMPTGTGKSVVIGGFIERAFQRYPGQRIIKLTHVKELITQNFEKLLAIWPTAPAGIYSAGLGRRDITCPIIYAGIATAIKAVEKFGHIDLMLIDECHLVSPKADTMYMAFIQGLKEVNPNLKVIGFTATQFRNGQGLLTEEGGLFTDTCIDMTTMDSFNWFLSEGYLCPLVPRPTATTLNLEGVGISQGDYNLKQLQESVDKEEVTYAAIQEAIELGQGREHWLVFASGVEHAINVTAMFESMGIPATCIHSKMKAVERDKRLADYKAGVYRVMVNNGILTTGFDFPALDLIIMLRPTRSPSLWVQMLGRGTRPFYSDGFDLTTTEGRLTAIANSSKRNCLVLDFAGNTRRLGPINDPVMPKKKGKGGGDAPVRICENCGIYCHASLVNCPECGFEFPRDVKFGFKAGVDALIKDGMEAPLVEEFVVERVVYREHKKEGRPTSIRANYYCNLHMFSEWICLEHEGFAKRKARIWWRERAGTEAPISVAEGFERLDELRTPIRIKVWTNKKHPEIMNYEYEEELPAVTEPGPGEPPINADSLPGENAPQPGLG